MTNEIMLIKTKQFQISPKELRGIIAVDYYKRMKLFLILFSVLAVINIIVSIIQQQFSWWLLYFFGFLAYILSVPYWLRLEGRTSALNFQNRYCEMDENFIAIFFEDGSITKLRYEHFIKVVKKGEFYFLYITKAQFHYLPIAAFESEKDMHRFDLFLEGKQLIKLW
ncbi:MULTISPECIES: YcxB family protein [unclassified Calothrix]|uniref:YcxB family protein n=1 Tax=unclassified Calothrix TaxID=2619626 RepID=UPI001F54D1C5|nr:MULTISPECIES: YcxB family protein [unclassified Calothrix]